MSGMDHRIRSALLDRSHGHYPVRQATCAPTVDGSR